MKFNVIIVLMACFFSSCSRYILMENSEAVQYSTVPERLSPQSEDYTNFIAPYSRFLITRNKDKSKKDAKFLLVYANKTGYINKTKGLTRKQRTSVKRYRTRFHEHFTAYERISKEIKAKYFEKPSTTSQTYSSSNGSSSSSYRPSTSSGGSVQVNGYYRKDGTYVRPHTRSAPRRR